MVTERPKGDFRSAVRELNFGKLCGSCRAVAGTGSGSAAERSYRQRGPRSGQSLSAFDSENSSLALRIELSGAR